jgi:hypothetical protein
MAITPPNGAVGPDPNESAAASFERAREFGQRAVAAERAADAASAARSRRQQARSMTGRLGDLPPAMLRRLGAKRRGR